jgi:hypothetical protein
LRPDDGVCQGSPKKGTAKQTVLVPFAGTAKVMFEVTYTPTGGEPTTKSKKLKLKKRR